MLMHFHISSLLSVNEIIITEIALLMESLATYPANDKQTTELSSICVVYALKRWPLISQEALARLQVSVYISNELIMERAKRTLRLLCGDIYPAKLFSSSPQGYTFSFCSLLLLFSFIQKIKFLNFTFQKQSTPLNYFTVTSNSLS